MSIKPLGCKAYGSIPHLPNSRMGAGDHYIDPALAKIATEKVRDENDYVVCQEKLDGSNVAVAKLKDQRIVPLVRSGYLAGSSPYLQHHIFSDWVYANYDRFNDLLHPGEWVSGEWLAMAHGTRYELQHEPFVAFDLWSNGERILYVDFRNRIDDRFEYARPLHFGAAAFSVDAALLALETRPNIHGALEPIEGAVWRVERHGKVEFLCKYVRHNKVDGKYLDRLLWNEGLEQYLPKKALDRLSSQLQTN